MKKRILAVIMAFSLLIPGGIVPMENAGNTVKAATDDPAGLWKDYTEELTMTDANGSELGNSEDKPILIESEGQLAALAQLVNDGTKENNRTCDKYFKLTKNLDLSEHYWIAIGVGGQEFQGHFDGNGKVIQGLKANERNEGKVFGLFGDVYAAGKGAGIKDLTILGAEIYASYVYKDNSARTQKSGYGGIVAASVYGNHSDGKDVKPVIENCRVQGVIVAMISGQSIDDLKYETDTGGIAGLVSYAVIKNCTVAGADIRTMAGDVGAFAGIISDHSEISNCMAAGYVTGAANVGGFAGDIQNGSIVESSITSATAASYSKNVGGFAGYAVYSGEDNETQPLIKNCIATGLVYCHESLMSASSGSFVGTNVARIEQCYAAAKVQVDNSSHLPGGFAGTNTVPASNTTAASGTITNCAYYKWDSEINDVCQNEAADSTTVNNIETKDSDEDMLAYIHEKAGGHFGTYCKGVQTAVPCKAGYTGDVMCQYDREIVKEGTSYTLHDGLEEHQWDEGVLQVEPQDGKEGEARYTCQVCKETKTVKVSQWPLPSATPTATPTATPSITPSATPVVTPTAIPTVTPTTPALLPTATPAQNATAAPTQNATAAPTQNATAVPSQQPTASPTQQPTEAPVITETPANGVKKGKVLKDSRGSTFKVTSADAENPEVCYEAPAKKAKGKVKIPAVVKVDGVTYRVTSVSSKAFNKNNNVTKIIIGKNVTKIGSKAFYKCKKLRLLVVKTRKLKAKNIASDAFKGIAKKTTVKVPKLKIKTYRKLFRKKGLSKEVNAIKRIYSSQEV